MIQAPRQPEQMVVDAEGYGDRLGQPAMPERTHGYVVRGMARVPQSRSYEGRFGRMFRRLPPFLPTDAQIDALAEAMVEHDGGGDNPDIPAGYTYLGQFVDHDLTFDPASSLERQNDPDALTNFRTPRFDLDCVYGSGPADQPYLYDRRREGGPFLLVGEHDDELDLPRNGQGTALIGDPRNDENVFVSQLHLTMLLFHNKVMEQLREFPEAGGADFAAAQRTVRWHYQWMVVHDFLRRIVGEQTFGEVLKREPKMPGGRPAERVELRFFSWRVRPFIPVEFSAAAYRFGHSMVRARYLLNSTVPDLPIFTSEPVEKDPRSHFGGFRILPPLWQVEWCRFFSVNGQGDGPLQPARLIDTRVAPPLHALPPEVAPGMSSLIRRNLTRGARLGLPSGQDVAAAMGAEPLTPEELGLPDRRPVPLWYYVLREAEVRAGGHHLGPVGGRIVAEVFLGLMAADPAAYLSVDPTWTPFLPAVARGDFTMADLIAFTGFGLKVIEGAS
ncbi:MAG TPA: peroxidase family protein [Thermomonospora sp.]|nr:peroxidase family protein [Thermomonospora sp.]